jgi:hypothetical protein
MDLGDIQNHAEACESVGPKVGGHQKPMTPTMPTKIVLQGLVLKKVDGGNGISHGNGSKQPKTKDAAAGRQFGSFGKKLADVVRGVRLGWGIEGRRQVWRKA